MNFPSGPIPPYSNVPIEPQNYNPSQFFISDITLGQTTLITTIVDMNFVIGQLIRIIIPLGYGCIQLNEQIGYVIALPKTNQIEVNIDSSMNIDSFISASLSQQPQIIPVGNVNSGVINQNGPNYSGIFIPGSFINIST